MSNDGILCELCALIRSSVPTVRNIVRKLSLENCLKAPWGLPRETRKLFAVLYCFLLFADLLLFSDCCVLCCVCLSLFYSKDKARNYNAHTQGLNDKQTQNNNKKQKAVGKKLTEVSDKPDGKTMIFLRLFCCNSSFVRPP